VLRGVTAALQPAADDQSEAARTDLIQPVRFPSIAAIRRSGPAGTGDHLAGQLPQRLRIHRVLAGPGRADRSSAVIVVLPPHLDLADGRQTGIAYTDNSVWSWGDHGWSEHGARGPGNGGGR
jgi:hypothetical protein